MAIGLLKLNILCLDELAFLCSFFLRHKIGWKCTFFQNFVEVAYDFRFQNRNLRFQRRNLYQKKNTTRRTDAPAPIATHDVALSDVASFLYLADIIDKFWALLSNSEMTEFHLNLRKRLNKQGCVSIKHAQIWLYKVDTFSASSS